MGRKRKARGLESEGKGHCGFLWPPLLVNKPGRVKLDKRKRPYKQCDHLEWRGGGWVGRLGEHGGFLWMQSPVGATER